jgi:hypothetical protein
VLHFREAFLPGQSWFKGMVLPSTNDSEAEITCPFLEQSKEKQ